MAHLLAPQASNPNLPVFFNVDGVVGAPPAANKREDVLLVQFAFKIISESAIATSEPVVTEAARAVTMSGIADPATINAIRVFQQARIARGSAGTVVDGRVSPAKEGYAFGRGIWTIVVLNESLQARNVQVWPRIDQIPGCPNELQQMVVRTVQGV